MAGRNIAAVRIERREDIRVWHPGLIAALASDCDLTPPELVANAFRPSEREIGPVFDC